MSKPEIIQDIENQVSAIDPNGDYMSGTLFIKKAGTQVSLGLDSMKKVLFRNDGNAFYILLTNENEDLWNDYRPYVINTANGDQDLNGGIIRINGTTIIGGTSLTINTPIIANQDTTINGILHLKSQQYQDAFSGALNLNNSNIYNVNSIYFADPCDNSAEGIHFKTTTTDYVDSLWGRDGVLYYVPVRKIGDTSKASYTIIHSGNYNSYTPTLTGRGASGNWNITATNAKYLAWNDSFDYSDSGVSWFDKNMTVGNGVQVNDGPTAGWWHILRFNHSNSNGYYTDLAIPFGSNGIYYKRITAGNVSGWYKVLDNLNYNSYALPLSGGTMNANSVIKFPASTGTIATSDPMAITYGRISAYGTLCINANTDNSGTEYVILTAGKGLSSSTADGLAIGTSTLTWQGATILTSSNYNSYTPTKTGGGASGTWGINISGNAAKLSVPQTAWYNETGVFVRVYTGHDATTNKIPSPYVTVLSMISSPARGSAIAADWRNGVHALYFNNLHDDAATYAWGAWRKIWVEGNSVTGAVWNDYAEYRESDFIEPGYCLIENGDDTLSKSTERMQAWAGISSDTWGFAQGQTDKAQTPIAVAGRVLVYPYRDRNKYKPGDCVCTAPDGKVDIMTEEEIYRHPDRIIGVVSCVPDYEEWGGGEKADRPSVKVDGRIWVRVK